MINYWLIKEILSAIQIFDSTLTAEEIKLEHPANSIFGDFSTNIAIVLAGRLKMSPKDLAEKIREKILAKENPDIQQIEIAGPGFINFHLSTSFFAKQLAEILANQENFGQNKFLTGRKVMIEYTDPNPFKEFHIGHLLSNTIGETLARLLEINGAEVKRACYQGDIGMNVAKALWGMFKLENKLPQEKDSLTTKIKFLGQAYVLGATEYEQGNQEAKEGIVIINKKLYKRSDPKLNEFYDLGRRWSLEHFETIYQKLGTKFDMYFFESEIWSVGQKLVEDGLIKGIFEKSDGAIVFRGEKYQPQLHTRVFINAGGLPTYEAKDLGLAKIKNEKYPFDLSISITGHEQDGYFQVLLEALKYVLPDLAPKIKHLSHGFLRLSSGKMSSRSGNVVTAETLIDKAKKKILTKIVDRDLNKKDKEEIAEKVAIGAIKYSILKQSVGRDIIFDFNKSLSWEGDSGPYLQYTYTRARSVLTKAGNFVSEFSPNLNQDKNSLGSDKLIRLLYQFPEVVERSYYDFAPQYLTTYLIELAGAFNGFYANNKIIGGDDENYFLTLTLAVSVILKRGLETLGLPVLEKM